MQTVYSLSILFFFDRDPVKSPRFFTCWRPVFSRFFSAPFNCSSRYFALLSTLKTTLVVISHNTLSFLSIYWPEIKIRKFCNEPRPPVDKHRLKTGSHARHQESFVACPLYFGPFVCCRLFK